MLLHVCLLSGVLVLSSGFVRQYHLVTKRKTWLDAQTHCRDYYTDLATIENTEEMEQLVSTASSTGYTSVWIGAYVHRPFKSEPSIEDDFWNKINQTGLKSFANYLDNTFCDSIINTGLLSYVNCSLQYPAICHNETHGNVYVNESMDWFRAWRYCRENFMYLLTCNTSSDSDYVVIPYGERAWTGCISYPYFYWSDDSSSLFRYWGDTTEVSFYSLPLFGAADIKKSGRWKLLDSAYKLPFICYDNLTVKDKPHKKVVEVRIQSEDSSVDLNDPDAKAELLRKFQDRLKLKGVTGVNLKWREQPDGKVFHKDRKKKKTEL